MAETSYYQNRLRRLLDDPDSFEETPGFRFALETGQEGVNRRMAAGGMRGSGNALAALTRYGTGLASQEYGNQVDRLGRLLGQEQQYDLGQGNLALGRDRLTLDQTLGTGRLDLDRELGRGRLGLDRDRLGLDTDRLALDRDLGEGQLGLGFYRAGNEYSLGRESNANTADRNWWDYSLGRERNDLTRSEAENNFNRDRERSGIDWFNADTARGRARSDDFYRGEEYRRRYQPYRMA